MMHTYAASRWRPCGYCACQPPCRSLFPALRVGIAASLVGAMVAELPTGAQAGLGARLLTGSYYGNTLGIWSALDHVGHARLLLSSSVALIGRLALRPPANR